MGVRRLARITHDWPACVPGAGRHASWRQICLGRAHPAVCERDSRSGDEVRLLLHKCANDYGPPTFLMMISHSQVCTPARISMPSGATASRADKSTRLGVDSRLGDSGRAHGNALRVSLDSITGLLVS